jgi:hypothetical protein
MQSGPRVFENINVKLNLDYSNAPLLGPQVTGQEGIKPEDSKSRSPGNGSGKANKTDKKKPGLPLLKQRRPCLMVSEGSAPPGDYTGNQSLALVDVLNCMPRI